MSLNIKRIQLTENGIAQDVDILTSAECVTFEDGENLQDKYDNGDIASVNTIGDVSELNGDIVTNLNELNASSRANTELIEELANRPSVAMALKKEVASGEWGSVSTLPYPFQSGDAVVVNNEIHILGSNNSSNRKICGAIWPEFVPVAHKKQLFLRIESKRVAHDNPSPVHSVAHTLRHYLRVCAQREQNPNFSPIAISIIYSVPVPAFLKVQLCGLDVLLARGDALSLSESYREGALPR